MTHEFKPGDRVRCIETWTTYVIDRGGEYVVEDVRGTVTGVQQVLVDGQWVPARYFEKVIAPEFVVGQTVSGTDYERLPVGSAVRMGAAAKTWTKTAPNEWGHAGSPRAHTDAAIERTMRTLTYLGDGTYTEPAAEPEDAEDAYVEPRPLAEGDAVLVWAQVDAQDGYAEEFSHTRLMVHGGNGRRTLYAMPDAIVRPEAGRVPPWIKRAQCASLKEHDGVLVRCTGTPLERCEKHGAPFSPSVLTWTDAEEYGRITESGAS